jgi:hypothetical protein
MDKKMRNGATEDDRDRDCDENDDQGMEQNEGRRVRRTRQSRVCRKIVWQQGWPAHSRIVDGERV